MKTLLALCMILFVACSVRGQTTAKDKDGTKWTQRSSDQTYATQPLTAGTMHLYSIDKACETHESDHAGHDAIFINPGVDLVIWSSSKSVKLKVKSITKHADCQKNNAQPFRRDPSAVTGTLIMSDYADAAFQGCAYEVVFSCGKDGETDPHIYVDGAKDPHLEKEIDDEITFLKAQRRELRKVEPNTRSKSQEK